MKNSEDITSEIALQISESNQPPLSAENFKILIDIEDSIYNSALKGEFSITYPDIVPVPVFAILYERGFRLQYGIEEKREWVWKGILSKRSYSSKTTISWGLRKPYSR
jgi:hypothetical protein